MRFVDFWSMEIAGESPSMLSTSGFSICLRTDAHRRTETPYSVSVPPRRSYQMPGRFSRSGKSGQDHQLISRDIQGIFFKLCSLVTSYFYILLRHCVSPLCHVCFCFIILTEFSEYTLRQESRICSHATDLFPVTPSISHFVFVCKHLFVFVCLFI